MAGLLDPGTTDLTRATHHLRELGRGCRALRLTGLVLTGAGIGLLVAQAQHVGIALIVGAGTAFVLSAISASDRDQLLIELILQGDAASIEGVPQLAERLCRDRERRRLAAGLRAAARAGRPGIQGLVTVDPARAADVAERLTALANSIGNPAVSISFTAIALGNALLRDPVRSPLYNPNVPERELSRVLDTIERGME